MLLRWTLSLVLIASCATWLGCAKLDELEIPDTRTQDSSSGDLVSDITADDSASVDQSTDQSTDQIDHLDPTTIPKFVTPLLVPPVMPPSARTAERTDYRIVARQFTAQILPSPLPSTTVFGYASADDPSTASYPAYTIEARTNERVRVEWINGLVDSDGHYLPHLLPIDQTLHWANPLGVPDMEGTALSPYTGPIPIITHLHGAHVADHSDGHPEAWYLPGASDLPPEATLAGGRFASVVPAPAGSAVFEYTNDQRASTLWYHDHTLGMTRANVYAGLAGFWLLRDDAEDALALPGPAPQLGDSPDAGIYEFPIVIQDRSFTHDGELWYPGSRADFDGYTGPFVPETEVPPIWNPEFFGDVMVVNGRAWPRATVEPRLYRFRLLNGCNSRFLVLQFDDANLSFHQIGNDGGLLPGAPVQAGRLLLAPAERADVLVDFSGLAVGTKVTLLNLGPDEPFKGPNTSLEPANPETTGQVVQFEVVAATPRGVAGSIPADLGVVTALTTDLPARDLTLNELIYEPADVPYEAQLGTLDGPMGWDEPITERVRVGDTEIWRLSNLTADAHPIHLHLVTFQVIDRTPLDAEALDDAMQHYRRGEGLRPVVEDFLVGAPQPPEPGEAGWKDTVIANPGEVTRIIARFDMAGMYVWHCHIIEHEDNEMMRPLEVFTP